MADNDVKISITTEAKGKGAEDTAKALDKLEKEAKSAESSSKALRKESQKVEVTNKALSRSLDKEADKLEEVARKARSTGDEFKRYEKTTSEVDAGNKKLKKSGSNTGLAFLEVSRAVEDAQYGIRGVLNNIPQMVLLFGGGGGLAAVISLAAVGLSQLNERMGKTKTSAGEVNTALSKLLDESLSKFRTQQADLKTEEGFTKAIEAQKIAVDSLSESLVLEHENLKIVREEEIKLAEVETKLALLKLNNSDLSAAEKSSKSAEIEGRLAALKNENETKTIKARLAEIEQKINRAKETIPSNRAEAAELEEKQVTSERIRQKENASKKSKEVAEKLTKRVSDYDADAFFASMARAFDGEEGRQQRVKGGALLRDQEAIHLDATGISDLAKLTESVRAEIEAGREYKTELAAIVKYGEEYRAKLRALEAKNPLLETTDAERAINKTTNSARLALHQTEQSDALAKEADELKKKQKNDLTRRENLTKEADALELEKVNLLQQQKNTQARLQGAQERQAKQAEFRGESTLQNTHQASAKDAHRELGEISDGILKDAKKTGRSAPELEAVKAKLKQVEEFLAESIASQGIDQEEFSKLKTLISDVKRDEGAKSKDQLTNFKQLAKALETNSNATIQLMVKTTGRMNNLTKRMNDLERANKQLGKSQGGGRAF